MTNGNALDDDDGSRREREPEPTVVRLERHRDAGPDVGMYETIPGSKPGTRTYRRTRPSEEKLHKVGEGAFEATKVALRPRTGLGRFMASARGVLIGQPLASSQLSHERLTKVKALAIFSSDALSSAAYATEEILLILILAGTAAMTKSIPISLAIATLAVIVVISYRQTIKAYPNGGGAYIVASENLGVLPGLTAGSALIVDYIMTVAVSTAAGVAAVTSAIPSLHSAKVELALIFVLLITLGNLRGIRESGTIFAIPTYFFIFTFGGMIAYGLIRIYVLGDDLHAAVPPSAIEPGTQTLTLFLFLRAFSSGAAALTG
ncbi:MAG TPA: amino acid permease, partial [Dehalococcoidia bacterium]